MENLNKENFWNELHAMYPEAVDHFCKWIDEYKKEVDWDNLFLRDHSHPNASKVKFHDLPYEFQNGIIARYEIELFNNRNGKGKEEYLKIAAVTREQVKGLFSEIQRRQINRIAKLN